MRNLYCIVSAFVASLGSDAELIFALKVAPRVLVMCSYFCVSDEFFFFSYLLSFCSFQPYAFLKKKNLSLLLMSATSVRVMSLLFFFLLSFSYLLYGAKIRVEFYLYFLKERKNKKNVCEVVSFE